MRESRVGDAAVEGRRRVLLVEGAAAANTAIRAALEEAGYDAHGLRLDSASAMAEALQQAGWQAVVWSVAPSGFGALEALAALRQKDLELPFLVVSDSLAAESAVALLKAGAHDYVSLENLARLGPSIERALREVEERREARRAAVVRDENLQVFSALARAGQELIGLSAKPDPWARLGQVTVQSVGCDCSYTVLRREDDGTFAPVAVVGLAAERRSEALAMTIPPEGLARLIGELRQRHTLQIQPAVALTPWAALPLHFGVTVALYVPLWSGHEIVGVHAAGNFGSSPLFSSAQERIAAGIGQLASSALPSFRLVAELERLRRPADGMSRL
jgi:CheY-like chemotaxis protein